jgi:NitT/TauT family transport system ATP-binding protein
MTIRVEHVKFQYPGPRGQRIFDDLNLVFREGSIYALLAFSGVGKSTLLKLVASLLAPTKGRIDLPSERIGYVPQESSLLPWLTVRENVSLGGGMLGAERSLADWRGELTGSFGLGGCLEQRPRHLSGGMKQRAAVISAVTSGAEILLLDEPFAGSDRIRKAAMYAALREYLVHKPQGIIVFASHDLGDVFSLGAHAIWLDSMTRQPTTISPSDREWGTSQREALLALTVQEAT